MPPPPADKIHRRDVDAQVPQGARAEVGVVGPLDGGPRLVALRVGLDPGYRQAHDLRQELADLVLGELVLGRELQDRWERGAGCRRGGEVLLGDVCIRELVG